jgi:hypothetical protein
MANRLLLYFIVLLALTKCSAFAASYVNGVALSDDYYGEMYVSYNTTAIDIATKDYYTDVTVNVVAGDLKGFTFANAILTATKAGEYEFRGNCSVKGTVNDNFHGGFSINNGEPLGKLEQSTIIKNAGGTQTFPFGGLYRLAAGDTIRVKLENITNTNDPTIEFMSVVIKRIGD